MTSAYTPLLGLVLPVTGELSGTWGTVWNDSGTSLIDAAIAGTTTLSSDADVTLTTTTGAANTSREAILLWTAGGTVTRNITAPAQSKIYTVINASSSTQSIVLRGAGPTTGVTIIKGESAVCAWNGSDFIKISNISGAGVFSSITNTGLTSGRVVYSTTGGLETDSANLLYSGTDLTVYGLTVGRGAGAVSTNTAVGASALAANTTGNENVAVGYIAMASNTTGADNIGVGRAALYANTTGNNIIAIGVNALVSNTTGANNVGVGMQALSGNTTASNNTAVGYQAGYSNTTGVNSVFGSGALYANTTGSSNNAFGYLALTANTTGVNNSAFGQQALSGNTTGSYNIAIGQEALRSNTTASQNTAVGYQAGYSNTTGDVNSFFGRFAGYSNTTGLQNAFIGANTGYGVTTGSYNTFVSGINPTGYAAGRFITTGSKNTILGPFDGNSGGLDIRTASNYIVLSDGDGNPRGIFDGSGNLLVGTTSSAKGTQGSIISAGTAQENLRLNGTGSQTFVTFNLSGTTVGSITASGSVTSYNVTSDQRLKENIQDAESASSLIDALQVRQYDWKEEGSHQRYGFVAQELVTVAPEAVHQPTDTEQMMAVDYSKLVPMLVKEVQSLRKRLAAAGL